MHDMKMRRIIYVPRSHLNVMSCLFSAQVVTATSVVVDDVVYQADGTEPSKAVTTWPLEALRSSSAIRHSLEAASAAEKFREWAKATDHLDGPLRSKETRLFSTFHSPKPPFVRLTIP